MKTVKIPANVALALKLKAGKKYTIVINNTTAFDRELGSFIFKNIDTKFEKLNGGESFRVATDKEGIRRIADFIDKVDKWKNAYIRIGTKNIYDRKQKIDKIDML